MTHTSIYSRLTTIIPAGLLCVLFAYACWLNGPIEMVLFSIKTSFGAWMAGSILFTLLFGPSMFPLPLPNDDEPTNALFRPKEEAEQDAMEYPKL